jgi:hypothetical protein
MRKKFHLRSVSYSYNGTLITSTLHKNVIAMAVVSFTYNPSYRRSDALLNRNAVGYHGALWSLPMTQNDSVGIMSMS